MTLAPGRFDYAPITERPIIKWPDNARVAFWVAPNMEFFEYMPESRPTQPDIPHYARMDYGNRVGFWRMLDVLNNNKVRACCCLNLEILDHFPEIKDAMVARACHQLSQTTLATSWTPARKFRAVFSYRVAMARNCLILAKKFSIRWRVA